MAQCAEDDLDLPAEHLCLVVFDLLWAAGPKDGVPDDVKDEAEGNLLHKELSTRKMVCVCVGSAEKEEGGGGRVWDAFF